MAYIKTNWLARVGTALNRFLKTNETSTEVELTNDPSGVSVPGTPFTVANMNKIEQGIYDAHVTADANASNLLANVNQGVKTTDSPTFAGVMLSDIYLPYPNMSAGDIGSFSFYSKLTSTTSTTYVSVGTFRIRDVALKLANANSGVTSVRVVFTKNGAASGESSQLRVMKNGTQVYESGMTISDTLTFDITLNALDILDFQIKVTANKWNPATPCLFKFSRALTNQETLYGSALGYDE